MKTQITITNIGKCLREPDKSLQREGGIIMTENCHGDSVSHYN
jgi:hypothetical protein